MNNPPTYVYELRLDSTRERLSELKKIFDNKNYKFFGDWRICIDIGSKINDLSAMLLEQLDNFRNERVPNESLAFWLTYFSDHKGVEKFVLPKRQFSLVDVVCVEIFGTSASRNIEKYMVEITGVAEEQLKNLRMHIGGDLIDGELNIEFKNIDSFSEINLGMIESFKKTLGRNAILKCRLLIESIADGQRNFDLAGNAKSLIELCDEFEFELSETQFGCDV